MTKNEACGADPKALIDVWERHTAAEFELKDADAAIATMTGNPVLIHVPVGTGATGREPLRKFYREIFIPQMPPDVELQLLSRSVGQNRVIDEFILRLTHTVRMEWFAPGIEATGRRLEVPHVGVIHFENDKIASEHIYWDQATVLVQLGVLDAKHLPVLGADEPERLLNPEAPANRLIERPTQGPRVSART
jgi:carboxymethylenebutenolidase